MPTLVSHPKFGAVACDETAADIIREHEAVCLIRKPFVEAAEHFRHVFVLCTALRLPEIADFVSSVNRQHRLRALFVRQDADPTWLPQFLERAHLRAVRNMLVHHDYSVPKRVLSAWEHGGQEQLIANATVANDKLFLNSCALETLEVPFDALPALKRIPKNARASFEISEEGSYIHWPKADIHLDIDAIRGALDPDWRARTLATHLTHSKRYGEAIAHLRKERNLRQSDIPGLSERQVRRIETGARLKTGALRFLASAHGLLLDDYLTRVAEVASGLQEKAIDVLPRHRSPSESDSTATE